VNSADGRTFGRETTKQASRTKPFWMAFSRV
jgi:hypothetical protein